VSTILIENLSRLVTKLKGEYGDAEEGHAKVKVEKFSKSVQENSLEKVQ